MLPMNFDAFETDDCKELIELWDEEQLENWKSINICNLNFVFVFFQANTFYFCFKLNTERE